MAIEKNVVCIITTLIFTSLVHAESGVKKNINFSIGTETFFTTYDEPGVMHNEGWLDGVSYSLSYQEQRNWSIKLEGMVAIGQVDYSSEKSGTMSDQNNYMADTRGIIEYIPDNSYISFFSGLAYRYLENDAQGRVSSTNNWGYNRISHYIYSPIGINLTFIQTGDWQFMLKLEYDRFWFGVQESELGYVSGYDDIRNNQYSGYGYRYSFAIQKKINTDCWISISPFFRYWNIDDSEVVADSSSRYWEPANETNEYGVNISVLF